MGVLHWRPNDLKYASCADVYHAITGHIQQYAWQQYAEGQNLKRLAWAIGSVQGTIKEDVNTIFDYSATDDDTDADTPDDDTLTEMARHFPANI